MIHASVRRALTACAVLPLLFGAAATVHAQCAPPNVPVTIDIDTDDFGYETGWSLTDVTTSTLLGSAAASPATPSCTASAFTASFCVDPTHCFNFTITDTFGDGNAGFFCIGDAEVNFNGNLVVNGTFNGTSDTTIFGAPGCAPPAPPNDLICDAQDINCGDAIPGSTIGSSSDTFHTQFGDFFFFNGAVWYSFTATSNSCVTVSTCSFSDYPSSIVAMRMFPGTDLCPADTPVFDLNTIIDVGLNCPGGGFGGQGQFSAQAGETWFIAVASFGNANPNEGNFTLTLECEAPPLNDAVCFAQEILLGVPTVWENSCASAQPGEINPGNGSGPDSCHADDGWCAGANTVENSLWYTFVAPHSGCVNIRVLDNAIFGDQQLAVYTVGDCNDFGTFTEVAANDDGSFIFWPELTPLPCLTEGQTYYVQLDGFFGTAGSGLLTIDDCGGEPLSVDAGECQHRIINDNNDLTDLNYLVPSASGGQPPVTYEWTVESGDAGGIRYVVGANAAVQPNVTTTFCVTGTDAVDCSVTDCVTVEVIDPACGNRGDKVMVCHFPGDGSTSHEICIDYCGLEYHLINHDDHAGACDISCTATNPAFDPLPLPPPPAVEPVTATPAVTLAVTGNPAGRGLNAEVVMTPAASDPRVRAELITRSGEVFAVLHDGPVEGGTTYRLKLDLAAIKGSLHAPLPNLAVRVGSSNNELRFKADLAGVIESYRNGEFMQDTDSTEATAPRPVLRRTR